MTPERFAKLRQVLTARQPDLTVIMENVHKSHNIAAALRTCDAVGIFEIHGISHEGEIPRHHMVSGGTRKYVRTYLHNDVITACRLLKASGHQLVAAQPTETAVDYREVDYTQPTALILGSELWGVSVAAAEIADVHVVVPMHGVVTSLNVSVAAAILLYEVRNQRHAAGMYDECRIPPDVFERILFEWSHPKIARRCRLQGIPYPPLTENGDLARNPFE